MIANNIERLMNFAKKGSEEYGPREVHEEAFYAEGDNLYISQAYCWRLISIIEAIALIFVVVFCVYVAGQNRFVPYVIAIGEDGSTFKAHSAQQASTIDESVLRAELKQFIVKSRSIVADPVLEHSNITDGTYSMLTGDARAYIDAWYQTSEYQPFDRMKKETVEVDVSSIVHSGDALMVAWTETTRSAKDGKITGTEPWEATIRVDFRPPVDEPNRNNPLGIYITFINWTKKL
jgi:type IV secretory pathway TrbF-like protein